MKLTSVCVYCGSSPGLRPELAAAARELGALLAGRGLTVVFGGGRVGLMGALADGALARGGRVVGIIPRALVDRELAHPGIEELITVDGMHERKALMEERADAFIALPGGIGTLDELFEIWTWRVLGIHAKPLGLLDVGGYWQPLVTLVDHLTAAGFLAPAYRAMLVTERDPEALLAALAR